MVVVGLMIVLSTYLWQQTAVRDGGLKTPMSFKALKWIAPSLVGELLGFIFSFLMQIIHHTACLQYPHVAVC